MRENGAANACDRCQRLETSMLDSKFKRLTSYCQHLTSDIQHLAVGSLLDTLAPVGGK